MYPQAVRIPVLYATVLRLASTAPAVIPDVDFLRLHSRCSCAHVLGIRRVPMNYRKLIRIMAAYILLISAPPASLAVDIETLLMPGEVISGHAKFESDCSSCHTRFSKNTQTRLCLDCHEKVDADITARDGFHGRIGKDGDTCKQCHSEH